MPTPNSKTPLHEKNTRVQLKHASIQRVLELATQAAAAGTLTKIKTDRGSLKMRPPAKR